MSSAGSWQDEAGGLLKFTFRAIKLRSSIPHEIENRTKSHESRDESRYVCLPLTAVQPALQGAVVRREIGSEHSQYLQPLTRRLAGLYVGPLADRLQASLPVHRLFPSAPSPHPTACSCHRRRSLVRATPRAVLSPLCPPGAFGRSTTGGNNKMNPFPSL